MAELSSNSFETSLPVLDVASPPCLPVASRSGRAGLRPFVSDGGAVSPWVAQPDGRGPMSNVSVAPLASIDCGRYVLFQRRPLTRRPCTYTLRVLLFGARTTMSRPGRRIVSFLNSGEPMT